MIVLEDVYKAYPMQHGAHCVLRGVDLVVRPGERLGVVGRNGAGKSTVIRLVSGAERPDRGRITRTMTVSWPIAFGGAFQGALTGLDNLRFICRVYGVDPRDKIAQVDDFAELGRFLREPVNTYSSGMRARLAFALSMAIEFDCFLIDEVVAVGDHRFTRKCEAQLFGERADRAMIIVSHNLAYVQRHCARIALLHDGRLSEFSDKQEVLDAYEAL